MTCEGHQGFGPPIRASLVHKTARGQQPKKTTHRNSTHNLPGTSCSTRPVMHRSSRRVGSAGKRIGRARELTMILVMSVQSFDKTLSRKQRLQEKQRRQLAVVDTVDKAEAKVRKAEVELAGAVAEAVQVFGDEQSASEGLDMPVEAIRRFLDMMQAETASSGDNADTP